MATAPEIASAFEKTDLLDTGVGKAHHMLKATYQRRRTKKEIDDDKAKVESEKIEQMELKEAFSL